MVKNLDAKIKKIIDGISDKEVKKIFKAPSLNDIGRNCAADYPPEFMAEHERALRELLPTLYGKMTEDYKREYANIYYVDNFIIAYMYLDHKVVDCNDFTTAKAIGYGAIQLGSGHKKLDSSIFKEGIKNGSFTAKDVLEYTVREPQSLNYFLPLLTDCGDREVWEELSKLVQTAKLEDTLRYSVLREMLTTENPQALLFFIDEIENNSYYRFKAMNDVVSDLGSYECVLPPKQVVAILKDAVNYDRQKYLGKGFKENYFFIKTLKRISTSNYDDYLRLALCDGSHRARLAALYTLTAADLLNKYAALVFNGGISIEDLAYMPYFSAKAANKADMPLIFEKLLGILDGMDKVNYHFKTDDDMPFARDLFKYSVVSDLAEIAVELKSKEYIAMLDARYASFKEEAQATYLDIVGDRTKLDRRACAIKFLKTDNYTAISTYDKMKITLTYDEAVAVSDYLKSKKQTVKTKIVKEFLASPDKKAIQQYLLEAKEEYKSEVGREMLGSSGKIQNDKLKEDRPQYSFQFTQECVFTLKEPTAQLNEIASWTFPKFDLKGISLNSFKLILDGLYKFIESNKNYEYKLWYSEGLVTFGSEFNSLVPTGWNTDGFSHYPLGEKLKELFKNTLTAEELASLLLLIHFANKSDKKYYSSIYGKMPFGIFDETNKVYDLLQEIRGEGHKLHYAYLVLSKLYFAIFNELITDDIRIKFVVLFSRPEFLAIDNEQIKNSASVILGGRRGIELSNWGEPLSKSEDKNALSALLYSQCVRVKSGCTARIYLEAAARQLENKMISPELLKYLILKNKVWLHELVDKKCNLYIYRKEYPYPEFKRCMLELIKEAVDAELSRGNLVTPYNNIIRSLKRIAGAEYFVRSVAAIRGLTIVRSPFGSEKNESISMIMKYTVKAEDDTYEKFAELISKYKIKREELVRASLFNPAFIDYAEKYLAIPHFKMAVYYFIAHLNDSEGFGEEELHERRVQTIKEFSDINYLDFKDGAFDYAWYKEMTESVSAENLKLIYDNAKYVTVGGLHKRAQRFFDAMGGKITKQECLEKINGTRNKDYCLIYSLIPIESKADLRERYLVLQDFLKGSKKYGAQRQLSERRTVDIALENLARSAGYADTNIFIFEIEADYPHDIYKKYTVGDVEITPEIDCKKFKVGYKVTKGGKNISSIPSKYGKNDTVVWLKEEIKSLNAKFKRISKSFEDAMTARIPFTAQQLVHMCREKTLETVISKLVFLCGTKLAVFEDGALRDLDGNEITGEAFVAHPVELKRINLLKDAIDYIIKNNVKQPFRQILREIYVKSEQELTQEEVLRFKGFNVDLKKCVSALKGKGWGVSEDIGLRKVYYRTNTVAAIFRKFDELYSLDFENLNRELHGILFLNRKTEEIIPLKDIDEITFSETLRDVDLMITISANAIYDYELAMSTVEIRHEILKSVIAILGLDNVTFLKDNVSVKGEYGTYLINIRTGLVFKEGKGNLLIDTAYSTDKPLLLDFADEDPMTADIISKAVVLSNDKAVRDPALLREIKD